MPDTCLTCQADRSEAGRARQRHFQSVPDDFTG